MRRAISLSIVSSVLVLTACDPSIWDGYEDEAPVHIVSPPAGGTVGAFGTLLVAYEATVNGVEVSRFTASGGIGAGEGSTFSAFKGFDGDGLAAVPGFAEAPLFNTCDMNECGLGHGASLAAFPEWTRPGGITLHGCVASAALGVGQIHVRCEDRLRDLETVAGVTGEALGASGAGIDFAQHRVGVAIFGAPRAGSGDGALYRLPSGGPSAVRVSLADAMAPAGGAIGTNVAVRPLSIRALMFATRLAYAGATQRVVVGTIDVDDADVMTVQIHACLEGARGYGGALAWGDLDDDGTAELAIGSTEESSAQEIEVFDGGDFGSVRPCTDADQPRPSAVIGCTDAVDSVEVSCDPRIGFGASLAIGDLDADGVNDLIAGAPSASPRGEASGGAVVVMAGSAGGLAELGERSHVLYHSSIQGGDRLGTSVAALRGRDRWEILAGAPGIRAVIVFLCSGIEGDRPQDVSGPRQCLGGS